MGEHVKAVTRLPVIRSFHNRTRNRSLQIHNGSIHALVFALVLACATVAATLHVHFLFASFFPILPSSTRIAATHTNSNMAPKPQTQKVYSSKEHHGALLIEHENLAANPLLRRVTTS